MAPKRDDPHHHDFADGLAIEAHRPIELVNRVIELTRASWNLKDCLRLRNDLPVMLQDFFRFTSNGPHSRDTSLAMLKTISNRVSKICFCCGLQRVEVRWEAMVNGFGSTGGYGDDVNIAIDRFPRGLSTHASAKEVVQTLLHELCHAMLRKFSCCNSACGDEACMGQREIEIGARGHGQAWKMLASFVEGLTEEMFGEQLSLDVDQDD